MRELTGGWSYDDYLDKMVRSYTDLVAYWIGPRPILSSIRLNQDDAFIVEQAVHCAERLAHFSILREKSK